MKTRTEKVYNLYKNGRITRLEMYHLLGIETDKKYLFKKADKAEFYRCELNSKGLWIVWDNVGDVLIKVDSMEAMFKGIENHNIIPEQLKRIGL